MSVPDPLFMEICDRLDHLGIAIDHLEKIQNPKECPVMDDIWCGRKLVEGRTDKKGKSGVRRSKYAPDTTLAFYNPKTHDVLLCKVVDTRLYTGEKALNEYVSVEGFKKVIPVAKDYADALNWYRTGGTGDETNAWARKEDLEKHGMVAIEVKPFAWVRLDY